MILLGNKVSRISLALDCVSSPAIASMDIHDGASKGSKRHKRQLKEALLVDTGIHAADSIDEDHPGKFEHLSMDAKAPRSTTSSHGGERSLFLSLSTSPINPQGDVDMTPITKNMSKAGEARKSGIDDIFKMKGGGSIKLEGVLSSCSDSCRVLETDTPTPLVESEMTGLNDDHSTLNRHLRGQSFTPLPHMEGSAGSSPTHAAMPSGIAPQLSWSIAGDTPSLGDFAEWDDEHKPKSELKSRPSSAASTETRNMVISPHDFQMWKEEHDLVDGENGASTPLPFFPEQSTRKEHRENQPRPESDRSNPFQTGRKPGAAHSGGAVPDSMPSVPQFVNTMGQRDYQVHKNGAKANGGMPPIWSGSKYEPTPDRMGMPPTPMFASSEYREENYFARSPMNDDRRDGMEYFHNPLSHMYGHHPQGANDRIRNLRGRMHPGAHMPPMPLHIPPPMGSHLPMTSPMGLPGKGMWSPHHHHGMPHPLASPHHMSSPLGSMTQSKRKCVPLKPPIPSKFQGDIDRAAKAQVPEFTSLVNFPGHMSQKQSANLPEGMRCCVMCGSACPCSTGTKCKKSGPGGKGCNDDDVHSGDMMGDKNAGYAIIPTQNKGLCTLCDVNVWVVVSTGLEIKWCKGCKNFRPWAAFGDKGLATKCLRCRERQREKYALQKEEKERTRVTTKSATAPSQS
jgi:hypothetical protein